MGKKRFTIGLVASNILDPFSNAVSRGAMAAAEELDVNLIIFPAKYFDIDYVGRELDAVYEYQYNSMVSYAAAGHLDYLIVCIGTIAYISSYERQKQILDFMSGTPILSVSSDIDGYECIKYDNYSGIRDAIDYLVQCQNRRNICIMAGDANNFECAERFEAYKNALEKNGIEFQQRYKMECDVSSNCTEEINRLCDSNPDMDAVFCINDDIAKTVYEVLKKRGRQIGRDVSVVGFDDLPFASKLEPPLSSIRADAFELGARAVERVVDRLSGVTAAARNVETAFIKRESCNYITTVYKTTDGLFDCDEKESAQRIVDYVLDDQSDTVFIDDVKSFCREFTYRVRKCFFGKCPTDDEISELADFISSFFDKYAGYVNIVSELFAVGDECYHWILRNSPESEKAAKVLYNVFSQKLALSMAASAQAAENAYNQHVHMSNLVIRDSLMFTDNLRESYAEILKKLHCIGVHTSYLYILDEPTPYVNGEFFPTDNIWYFKSYQYGTGYYVVPDEKQRVTGEGLYRNDYIDESRRMTLVAADLYSNELQYGLLLFEPGDSSVFQNYELMVYQFSAAVKIIELLSKQEYMLNELHMKNLVLKEMSNVDELTGILNRRGFYDLANELIRKSENVGKRLIVCYADMDKLKYVNDNYGHIEGDFSIKALAGCITAMAGERGIAARMGGDEFAALVIADETVSAEEMLRRKAEYIENLNQTCGKPYRINMSAGFYECVCENTYDLKAALDKADEMLYVKKSKR